MNQKLTELLRSLSFANHTLNALIELAVSAGHDTNQLERAISLIEWDLRDIRTAIRQQANEANRPAEVATD